jgi:hypothetical protein
MLVVRTIVALSAIEGLGVFAAEFIPAGTLVRDVTSEPQIVLTPEQYEALPEGCKPDVYKYSWNDVDGNFHVCFGPECFLNHSPNASLTMSGENHVAARDILAGEEITADYRKYSHKDPSRSWLNN